MNTQVEITTNEIWVHTRCLSHQEKYSHGILWKEAILINKVCIYNFFFLL